jgi:hypothetical protein
MVPVFFGLLIFMTLPMNWCFHDARIPADPIKYLVPDAAPGISGAAARFRPLAFTQDRTICQCNVNAGIFPPNRISALLIPMIDDIPIVDIIRPTHATKKKGIFRMVKCCYNIVTI